MSLRIEKLETAEANRSTEEQKKEEEPDQPIMMQPQLMLTGTGAYAQPPMTQPVRYRKLCLEFNLYFRIPSNNPEWASQEWVNPEWECPEWVKCQINTWEGINKSIYLGNCSCFFVSLSVTTYVTTYTHVFRTTYTKTTSLSHVLLRLHPFHPFFLSYFSSSSAPDTISSGIIMNVQFIYDNNDVT